MSTHLGSITCRACGRQYARKPELAGRRVKCKCGEVMVMPALPDPEPPVEDEYDLAPEPFEAPAGHSPGRVPLAPVVPTSAAPVAPVATGIGPARPAAQVGSPRQLSYPSLTRRDRDDAQEQRSLIKLAVAVVLLIVIGGGAIMGLRYLAGPKAATTPGLGDDDEVARMIREFGAAEARQWLKEHSGRMIGGYTPSQAEHHVNRWYELGATKVLSFGALISTAIAVELPQDAEQRQAIFEEAKRYRTSSDFRPARDVGQKYLLIRLGL